MMPRKFKIARTIRRPTVVGLVPPTDQPDVHVFFWLDGLTIPDYFRWCWHPDSGDFVVGTAYRHALMIPKGDDTQPAESWLRGFVFPAEQLVAVRTYFWPLDAYDDWRAAHVQLDRRVYMSFVALASPSLPGFSFVGQVNNSWLAQNFGSHADSW